MVRYQTRKRSGFVLITMAAASIAMIGILGLAVDLGRMFIAKSETQAFVDAAALAAALELNGENSVISAAQTVVAASQNTWNLNTVTPTGAVVDFATTATGPWDPSPNPATGYIYTRVRLTVSEQLYFVPIIVNAYAQNVASQAIAGQISIA